MTSRRLLLPSVLIPSLLEGRVKEVWLPIPMADPVYHQFQKTLSYKGNVIAQFRYTPFNAPADYKSPYRIGDELWLAETFWIEHDSDCEEYSGMFDCGINIKEDDWARIWYCATDKVHGDTLFYSKHSSTQMPQWAARPNRWTVTGIEPREVKGITHEESVNAGAEFMPPADVREQRLSVAQIVFASFWDTSYPRYPFNTSWAWRYQIKEA